MNKSQTNKSITKSNKTNVSNLMQKTWINALKNFGKIMLSALIVFCYITSLVYFISPMSASKMFNFLGLKRAEESCYIFSYERDKNIVNLYNLIIFEMNQNNYQKELIYLNQMFADDNYNNFCNKLDESALKTVKDKSLVAYSCNANSFLINQKVKCMYNIKISEVSICDFIRGKLEKSDMVEYSLATYVDLILADTDYQNKLNNLFKDKSLMDLLDAKISKLKTLSEENNITVAQELIIQNALVSNAKSRYLILKNVSLQSDEINNAKTFYETEYAYYKTLISKK